MAIKWQDGIDEDDAVFDDLENNLENETAEVSDGYSPEQEAELRGFARRFQGDVRVLVRGYMEQFFSDKMLHCGGKIPNSLLFAERRISLVLNYDIVRGVERAYNYLEHMATPEAVEKAKLNGEVTDDIKLVNETLNLLARSCIPQQFAGGMMLLYLEFVEGINIGTHP